MHVYDTASHPYTQPHMHACTRTASPLPPSLSLLSQTEELWNFLTNHPKVALTHSVNELEENLLVSDA